MNNSQSRMQLKYVQACLLLKHAMHTQNEELKSYALSLKIQEQNVDNYDYATETLADALTLNHDNASEVTIDELEVEIEVSIESAFAEEAAFNEE